MIRPTAPASCVIREFLYVKMCNCSRFHNDSWYGSAKWSPTLTTFLGSVHYHVETVLTQYCSYLSTDFVEHPFLVDFQPIIRSGIYVMRFFTLIFQERRIYIYHYSLLSFRSPPASQVDARDNVIQPLETPQIYGLFQRPLTIIFQVWTRLWMSNFLLVSFMKLITNQDFALLRLWTLLILILIICVLTIINLTIIIFNFI